MSKYYAFLATVGLMLCTIAIYAQPTFTFSPSNVNPNNGDQITVDVIVDDFTDIASYQYSINWTETHLDYVGVSNFNLTGLSAGNFGTTMTADGRLSTLWSDPFAGTQTLANGTVLFTITFDVITGSGTNSNLIFSGTPTGMEIIQQTMSGLQDVTGQTTFNNVSFSFNGGNTGSGCAFTGFGLTVETDSAATGEQLCLDVLACNFTDIVSMQYTTEFNPDLLQFDSMTNFNLPNLDSGSFGYTNTGNGFVTFSWDSQGTPVTVADETVIYTMCFTAIGAGGTQDTVQLNGALVSVEITDANSMGADIGMETEDGIAKITGTSSSAVTVIASCETGSPGDTVSVEVSVRDFENMLGLQYSMGWDETIIDFVDVQWSGALPGTPNFNTSAALVDAGKLTFLWTEPTASGATLADETVIYTIRYEVIGSISDVSSITFTSDPTAIEATQNNGSPEVVPLARIPGKVEVVGDTSGALELFLTNETGCPGDTVYVEVGVRNFSQIYSMQYDIRWDNTHVEYLGTTAYNLSGLTAGNFNAPSDSILRLSWVEPVLSPQTLADSTRIYSICFEVLGAEGTNSTVEFLDNGGTHLVEIAGPGGVVNPYVLTNGVVNASCPSGTPFEVTDTTITNVACHGELTGAIDISVTGGSGSYTYTWSNGPSTQDISGLAAGSYTVTITDGLTTEIETYVITEPAAALAATASATDASCNGFSDGSVTVSASGGTSPYTYVWSNSLGTMQTINGVAAGTYTVTVTDANMCTTTASTTVGQPAVLNATASSTNVSCNGLADGTLNAGASGGTPGYSFAWSNGLGTSPTVNSVGPGTYTVTVTDNNMCTATATATITEPAVLAATATPSPVSCNGANDGSVMVDVVGGTPGYSYLWSNAGTTPTISSLAPGTYTVTVTDLNMCTTTASATVIEPNALSVSGNVSNESAVDAEDGAIDITASGGTMPYSYNWGAQGTDPDLVSLPPGTYTVTVTDANMCTISASFTVNAFDAPMITVDNVSDVSCNGNNDGAISISVNGGISPYTYSWTGPSNPPANEDITNLLSGIYTVTVTDNIGTTAVETITVDQPSAITISVTSSSDVSCNNANDGNIDMSVTGGTPVYSYDWGIGIANQDLFGLGGGTYTLTVTDGNGCTAAGPSVVIDEPDPIVITLNSLNDPDCNGGTNGSIDVSVSGGTPGYTYAWTGGGNAEDFSGVGAGTYTLTVTDSRGCTEVSTAYTLDEPTAINVFSNITNVSCHGLSDGAISLTVSGGTPGYTYSWDNGLPPAQNQTGLGAGTYFVTVTDANGCEVVEGPINITEPDEIILSSSVTNASDAGDDGAIDLSVSGGTPGYTYNWNTSATSQDLSGLASGCYTVTVTDTNGCTATDSIKVEGIIILTGEVSDVSCFGNNDGAIDITVSGGIAPYVYSWSAGVDPSNAEDASALVAGDYTVTVTDANGGFAVATFTVNTPEALTISMVDIVDESGEGCNGSINITVIGGTLPYSYQWSNGASSQDITDLCKGDYSVMIIDGNGCVIISTEYTVLPAPLTVANTNGTTPVSCNGGDDGVLCLSVLGGCAPYTFDIGDGSPMIDTEGSVCFDGLSQGSYTVTITDGGTPQMTLEHTMTVVEPDPIEIVVIDLNNNTDPDCSDPNGSINISVSGGAGGYTYMWSDGNESEDNFNLCHGQYNVTVTDANGCEQSLNAITVILGLNIDVESTIDVSCIDACDGSIDITVTGGQQPYTYNWSSGQAVPDPGSLCAGSYDVTVTDANNLTATLFGIQINAPSTALMLTTNSVTIPTADQNDGAIDINVTGGWGNYTYSWNGPNGFSANTQDVGGLEEGTYTVTVEDANGCVQIMTFTLISERIEVELFGTDPSCNGMDDGEVDAVVSGGSGTYTYDWNIDQGTPTIFGLPGGTYSVTVTDDANPGLTAEASITLTDPDPIEIDVIVTASSGAADGTATATVTGGTMPYAYAWSNGATTEVADGLRGGFYGLQVVDAYGCEAFLAQIEVPVDGECLSTKEVISVNGDGKNEEFIIQCIENYNNTLSIFNRWGQLVYEATNYDNTWNGVDQSGNPLPEDGYFFVLEYEDNGETLQIKGAITLLR